MRYGKHKHKGSYVLEELQKARDLASDEDKDKYQKDIDNYFFGTKLKRKSKKERKRERKKRQQMMEEDYG